MFSRTLVTLAEMHYSSGLIGISDFEERCRVAAWLDDGSGRVRDPRDADGEVADPEREEESSRDRAEVTTRTGSPGGPDDPGYLQFLFMGWVFTKADPDPYPSTPHGHWQDQNRKWPKLDPYRGRAFSRKDSEDPARRLSKAQMQILWRDEGFRDFCRGHLSWYRENFRHHEFRVPRDRILFLPRW